MAQNFISRFRRVVFFSLLLCSEYLLASEVFILSYQSQVKDSQLIYQSLFASKAMTPVHKKIVRETTILLTKKCPSHKFFSCYESEVLEFLLHGNVHIRSIDKSEKLVATNFTELNISPQYVQVEFNDTSVKISLLKSTPK
jgi:hypothetical protein